MPGDSMREAMAISEMLLARQAGFHRAAHARNNEAIRALLGLWVSELPPMIVFGPGGIVVGLSYGREMIVRVEDLA